MNFDAPHRRLNPLTGEWVLVSPHRARRPWLGQVEKIPPVNLPAYNPDCYLCPGNARAGGRQNPGGGGGHPRPPAPPATEGGPGAHPPAPPATPGARGPPPRRPAPRAPGHPTTAAAAPARRRRPPRTPPATRGCATAPRPAPPLPPGPPRPAAAPRADSHRRSSCRHRSPAARSAHGPAGRAASDRPSAADGSRP